MPCACHQCKFQAPFKNLRNENALKIPWKISTSLMSPTTNPCWKNACFQNYFKNAKMLNNIAKKEKQKGRKSYRRQRCLCSLLSVGADHYRRAQHDARIPAPARRRTSFCKTDRCSVGLLYCRRFALVITAQVWLTAQVSPWLLCREERCASNTLCLPST